MKFVKKFHKNELFLQKIMRMIKLKRELTEMKNKRRMIKMLQLIIIIRSFKKVEIEWQVPSQIEVLQDYTKRKTNKLLQRMKLKNNKQFKLKCLYFKV